MLPIYQAISFIQILEFGGRTKPWLVTVMTDNGPKNYVVKIFTLQQNLTRYSVQNEVIGNRLASEFNFLVPKPALVEFSENFKMHLPAEALMVLDQADERLKFGCEHIENVILYRPPVNKKSLESRIEIDSLFAFDNLIRNRDRNNGKPNLLINKSDAILIDHELGFEDISRAIQDVQQKQWPPEFMNNHLCYSFLKRAFASKKRTYFDPFQQDAASINLQRIREDLTQLELYEYITQSDDILDWLKYVRQNCSKFVQLLRKGLE